ncbi:HTH-type transcriptional regulator RutR [Aquisphaera giovannonii]|uniref:HTH-type transcriptional regulator RutR n=1 Tax=Aquisphaera giovannonii TaxID=406548 RepID=A0A5B9VVC5_9BACT|nr:TetR/AcrR family transcriptional regulator [Aquisphaera giovannonii]QEH32303.1 HTH-type transcriptional regulator RutR [Aquisphaera giovannonii]
MSRNGVQDEAAAGPEKRWARRKHARPGELIAAALDCFAERGFAATRLEEVAARAGVTKGTVYLYFPNKEELFKAVVRESLIANLEKALEGVAPAGDDPEARLRRLVDFMIGKVLDSPLAVIPKLVIAEASNFPELAKFYLDEVIGRGRRHVAAAIREGIERGQFRPVDPEHAFFSFVAPILLAAIWSRTFGPVDDRPLDGPAMIRDHLELFFRGLAPGPATTARASETKRRKR